MKYYWISETEYDPSGSSNSSFYVGGVDIFKYIAFAWLFTYWMYSKYQDLIKQHIYQFYLSLFYL